MWYVLCSTGNIDFGGYPIALEAFSNTSNFKIDWRASWSPIKGAEWGTFLQCLAHRSPLSIRQCRTPNKCPSTPAVSHCRSLEHMSDNLTGAMKCLHQIINTFIDRSQSIFFLFLSHQNDAAGQIIWLNTFTFHHLTTKTFKWKCNYTKFWKWANLFLSLF